MLSPGWQVIGPMPGLHVKYVSVHTLDPESWAGKQGVSLGDRIVALNDGDVSALSFQELSKQMCKRPLKLKFAGFADAYGSDVHMPDHIDHGHNGIMPKKKPRF